MTAVQLRSVRKDFGHVTAIDRLDLEIASGELVALLGPSGCGKTTTLRMIAGLETLSAGQILFDGRDVSAVAVRNRNVGMVFQRHALFPHMSVEKNVLFGLRVRGTDKAEAAGRLEEMLDVVQLQPFRHRFPAQLSGGQMQRVAIARTLITRPSVLMLDEPLASLDTGLRAEMRRFVRDLQRRLGVTTIFVTHDQTEAMELADRVAVILDGRLAQFDPPDVLYRRPDSIGVAAFMGATNLFPAHISGQTATTAVGVFTFGDPAPDDPAPAGTATVMLRSEAIDLHIDPPGESLPGENMNVIRGTVSARDFFGASVTYSIACAAGTIQVTEHSRRMVATGQQVWLTIPPDRVWIIRNKT